MANADQKERYQTPYSIDVMNFEGIQFEDHETPEGIILEKKGIHRLTRVLRSLQGLLEEAPDGKGRKACL